MAAGHAPPGDEYSTSSTRCSTTQFRAGGWAVARNEYSGTAALPALRIAFAGSGSACPAPSLYPRIPMQKTVPFAALVGIDWADRKHDVCLCAAGSTKRERSVVPHTTAALRDWANKLRARFDGAPVAVCIELSQGPIVSALLEHDFFVLFPVQPATLARYRDRKSTRLNSSHSQISYAVFCLKKKKKNKKKSQSYKHKTDVLYELNIHVV